jgi:hypothetical protein
MVRRRTRMTTASGRNRGYEGTTSCARESRVPSKNSAGQGRSQGFAVGQATAASKRATHPAVRDTRHDQRLGDNLDAAGPSCTPRALPSLIQLLT